METEYAFEMATSAIRFGSGVTRELGAELSDLGGKQSVLVFIDPLLRNLPPVAHGPCSRSKTTRFVHSRL